MKKITLFLLLMTFCFSYSIKEFTTCKNVKNLTPIGPTSQFSIKDKRVYAFAYFKDIKQKRDIDFIWEKKVKNRWRLYADIKLPIYPGSRWRTFSYITIRPYFKGKWRVTIIDGNNTIKFQEFNISK